MEAREIFMLKDRKQSNTLKNGQKVIHILPHNDETESPLRWTQCVRHISVCVFKRERKNKKSVKIQPNNLKQ
jgi:hypothetical protein